MNIFKSANAWVDRAEDFSLKQMVRMAMLVVGSLTALALTIAIIAGAMVRNPITTLLVVVPAAIVGLCYFLPWLLKDDDQ